MARRRAVLGWCAVMVVGAAAVAACRSDASSGTTAAAGGSRASVAAGGAALGGGGGAAGAGGLADAGAEVPDWARCEPLDYCEVVPNRCCYGGCAPTPFEDVVAIQTSYANEDAFRASVCGDDAGADCSSTCAPGILGMGLSPSFYAVCEGGRCVAHDAHAEDLSRCEKDADCELFVADCCEGSFWRPVVKGVPTAKAAHAAFDAHVCEGGDPCPVGRGPFDWQFPGVAVVCDASKHCQATRRACPLAPPDEGAPCDGAVDDLWCTWGDDPRVECRTGAYCAHGAWKRSTDRESLYGAAWCGRIAAPGEDGCLASKDEAGAHCSVVGQHCDLGDGLLCVCAKCAQPDCRGPQWACGSPSPDPRCPPVLPNEGAWCAVDRLECVYAFGTCQPPPAWRATCWQGVWSLDAGLCPP